MLQFRVRCWVGVLHRPCVPGLGLRDRWLLLSHSLEGSDPEDPELECLTLPTCACVCCCCWPDKLSVNTCTQWMGIEKCTHTQICIYIYNKLDNQVHRNSTIPASMQTKPWLNAWPMSGVCVCGLNMLKGQKKQRLVYHPAVTFHIFWPLQYVIHTYSHIQRQTLAHNETWYSYKHIKQTKAS